MTGALSSWSTAALKPVRNAPTMIKNAQAGFVRHSASVDRETGQNS